jgi:hypothetical protein
MNIDVPPCPVAKQGCHADSYWYLIPINGHVNNVATQSIMITPLSVRIKGLAHEICDRTGSASRCN